MKRRGFLQVLAGIAAAVPVLAKAKEPKTFKRISGIRVQGTDYGGRPVEEELTFGVAPVKREGGPLPEEYQEPHYTVAIDHGSPEGDWTAFCVAYHYGRDTQVIASRAVSRQDLLDCTDPGDAARARRVVLRAGAGVECLAGGAAHARNRRHAQRAPHQVRGLESAHTRRGRRL